MAEAIMASLVVGFLVVAALNAAGSSGLAQYRASERVTARFLADGLMAEIVALSYEDPRGTILWGREVGETAISKANYNDVDDYDDWQESPPQDRSGSALAELTGWKRTVDVDWVNPTNVGDVSLIETGAKRIRVTVLHNNNVVARRTAIRTKAP
ncbi:MAG TPA: hypothetical protein VHP11_14510 [Tepidisphaeraceae bacterium]|nr:hypothetical protein [Tepidisphaeraceae bacterium]